MSDEVEENISGLSEKRAPLIPELVGLMANFINGPTTQNYRNLTSALLKYLEVYTVEQQLDAATSRPAVNQCQAQGCDAAPLSEQCPFCFDHLP